MLNFRPQRSGDPDWFMQTPLLTGLLCAICVIVSLASFAAKGGGSTGLSQLAHFGFVNQEDIWNGRWWGLFTTVFLHADYLHLLFNMLWLYQLGSVMERSLNALVYVLFLAAAAAVGSGVELAFSGTTGIGASGVVYAMFGLMWAGRGRYPEWGGYANPANLRLFIGWGIFCVIATQLHWLAIANGAHAGGFLFGLSVGWLFFSSRPLRWLWALPLAGLIALTLLSVTWMPWSEAWNFWKGNREFARQHYSQAIGLYQRSLSRGGDAYSNWYNISLAWDALGDEAEQNHQPAEAARDKTQAQEAAGKAGPDPDGNGQ